MVFWLRECALCDAADLQHRQSPDKIRSCLLHNIPGNGQQVSGHKASNIVPLWLIFTRTGGVGSASWQPPCPGKATIDEGEAGTLSMMHPSVFANCWEMAQKSGPSSLKSLSISHSQARRGWWLRERKCVIPVPKEDGAVTPGFCLSHGVDGQEQQQLKYSIRAVI